MKFIFFWVEMWKFLPRYVLGLANARNRPANSRSDRLYFWTTFGLYEPLWWLQNHLGFQKYLDLSLEKEMSKKQPGN